MEPRRRFRFLKELASGGFGRVYLAEMVTGEDFSTAVAIKVLHARWLNNNEIVSRSRDEARLLGRLRHANIVRVEDLTSVTGQCAIVMEYLNGVDVRTICTHLHEHGRQLPRQALFEIVGGVASALDAAYNSHPPQGGDPLRVIHRDIKPSNIMVTIEGDVKVLDFGTARATFAQREAQTQALAFGSTAFMSPERHMGDDDTPSADVFSLGITMYEMLTSQGFGKIQVRRERFEETLDERIGEIDLSMLGDAARTEAFALLRGMLAYEVESRPSAAEVVERVEHLSEATRDGGLKRFAREVVRPLKATEVVPQDPNDPLTGTTVYEDTGHFTDPRGFRPAAVGVDGFLPPPPNATTPIPVSEASPGGPAGGMYASTRAGATLPPSEFALPAPPPILMPHPTRVPDPPLASTLAMPHPTADPFEEPPPRASTGPALKLAAALVAFILLGAVAAVALWVATAKVEPAPVAPTQTAVEPPRAGLPRGTSAPDWRPNAAGKGGALLTIPGGATDVSIIGTSTHADWDGSGWFRVRDVPPGVYRTRVKRPGTDASVRGDFSVTAGRTCMWTFQTDGSWTGGECR